MQHVAICMAFIYSLCDIIGCGVGRSHKEEAHELALTHQEISRSLSKLTQ